MIKKVISLLSVVAIAALSGPASGLSSDIEKELKAAEYVYISSTRKDGSLGKPAEIWFLFHEGAVYVGTRATSWRVKRIGWGRPQAKIAVGKPDGPAFKAIGELVDDEDIQARVLETFAEKYPKGWERYAADFRNGFKDGSRVVVKYTPAIE